MKPAFIAWRALVSTSGTDVIERCTTRLPIRLPGASIALAAAVCLLAASAGATTIQFATPPGLNFEGKPVNAMAIFEMDSLHNQISISILNMQVDPTAVTQLVSGVAFNLSNGALPGTLTNPTGKALTFDTNGIPTTINAYSYGWKLEKTTQTIGDTTAGGLFMCAVCQGGPVSGLLRNGTVDQLVIGGPGADGVYPKITGVHRWNNPGNTVFAPGFGSSIPVFKLTVSALPPTAKITHVTLTFGNAFAPAYQAPAYYQAPEASTWAAVAGGFAILWAARRRREKRS